MEQQASQTSGNLYSSLARKRGELAVVGDIARFRVFIANGGVGTVVMSGMMDQPGMHVNGALMATLPLDRPVVVPVRRFRIAVSAELPPRSSLVPSADGGLPPPLAEARPGDAAFLIIPARLRTAVPRLVVTPEAPPAPANMTSPKVTLAPEATPPALAALVGDGAILRVKLDPARPPEEAVALEWTAQVIARRTAAEGGGETPPANVRLRLIYRPHFRLLLPVAPADAFAAGAAFSLAASDGVTVAVFEPDDSGRQTLRRCRMPAVSRSRSSPARPPDADASWPPRRVMGVLHRERSWLPRVLSATALFPTAFGRSALASAPPGGSHGRIH